MKEDAGGGLGAEYAPEPGSLSGCSPRTMSASPLLYLALSLYWYCFSLNSLSVHKVPNSLWVSRNKREDAESPVELAGQVSQRGWKVGRWLGLRGVSFCPLKMRSLSLHQQGHKKQEGSQAALRASRALPSPPPSPRLSSRAHRRPLIQTKGQTTGDCHPLVVPRGEQAATGVCIGRASDLSGHPLEVPDVLEQPR